MKTLHIINGLGTGGAERSLAELLVRLPDHGIEPTVVCLDGRREGVEASMLTSDVKVDVLDAESRRGQLRQLRTLIRDRRPDLVHTSIFEADVLGRLASIGSAPVLSSIVNTTYGRHRLSDPRVSARKLRVAQGIDSLTARHLTAHLHGITDAVKQAAVRDLRIRPEAVSVIPRGRNAGRLGSFSQERRERSRAMLGLPADAVVALNIGRREHQKGHLALLEAAHMARNDNPDLIWLIAGRDGNSSAELSAAHDQLGLGDTVRFLGHREDIGDLLVAADVFVFPSLYEGLGGALLEAMALKVPIVASDIPAVREVLDGGRCGMLSPLGNTAAFAQAVTALLSDDQQRVALATAGLARFQSTYTLERTVNGMVNLFEQVAAGNVPRP
jgi:glycosyltransferase involved in cell wall biosynthesis